MDDFGSEADEEYWNIITGMTTTERMAKLYGPPQTDKK